LNRPMMPDFDLPGSVIQNIILPCAGRLQPEHVLKAFDSGSSVVAVIACEERNCHYTEGSRRCFLRVDYLRPLLEEIGLREGRLLFFRLPEMLEVDYAPPQGRFDSIDPADSLETRFADVRDQIIEALRIYPSSPLQELSGYVPDMPGQAMETGDE
jgi:hypothetical protein